MAENPPPQPKQCGVGNCLCPGKPLKPVWDETRLVWRILLAQLSHFFEFDCSYFVDCYLFLLVLFFEKFGDRGGQD